MVRCEKRRLIWGYNVSLCQIKRTQGLYKLTLLRLASFLWAIGKQHSPRCDAAERGVPSGAILFARRNFIEKSDKKIKITPNTPKNESGLIQLIMMGESIRQIWVKERSVDVAVSLQLLLTHIRLMCVLWHIGKHCFLRSTTQCPIFHRKVKENLN